MILFVSRLLAPSISFNVVFGPSRDLGRRLGRQTSPHKKATRQPGMQPIESLDFSIYKAKVTEILEGSDLETITAKSIRKLIQGEFNHDLSAVKKEFDSCSIEHFQKYCEFKELAKTFGGTSTTASPSTAAPKTPMSQKSEDNAAFKVKKEPRAAKPASAPKKGASRVKSSYIVTEDDEDDEDGGDHDASFLGEFDYLPHRVTRGAGRGGSDAASSSATTKRKRNPSSCVVSDELAAVIGCKEVFKNEITRKVWDYIKEHDLQDPSNKQYILCDELMQKLAAEGDDISKLYMFHLSRVLSPHITIIKKDTRAKKAKKEGGESGGGSKKFNKLHYLSPGLMELAGVEQETRPQITAKLWVYIKEHKLQGKMITLIYWIYPLSNYTLHHLIHYSDPKNGQFILNDELMRRIFKKKRMSMFEMAKVILILHLPVSN